MAVETLLLRDGTNATLRAARPQDAVLLKAMHERLSPGSIYYRYLRNYAPSLEDLERICRIEEGSGKATVATIQEPEETIVGLAYYMVSPEKPEPNAEPGILVEDRFQGKGLGVALFRQLCLQAKAQGIHEFEALIHAANQQMMYVIRKSGFPFMGRYTYGMREVRIWLKESENVPWPLAS